MKANDKPDLNLQGAILQLGQFLTELRRGPRTSPPAEEIKAEVDRVLELVRKQPIRKLLGISQGVIADSDYLRLKAVAYLAWQMVGDQITAIQLEAVAAVVGDPAEAPGIRTLTARHQLARMVEDGIIEYSPSPGEAWSGRLVLSNAIFRWISGESENRGGFLIRGQTKRIDGKRAPTKAVTAKDLYEKVNKEVLGLSPQIRALASRIALHNARARLFQEGLRDQHVGQMVACVIGPSGSGKSYLVNRLAGHSGLPTCSFDITSVTSQGYVGDDLDSLYRLLINAAGGDLQAASRGLLAIDEVDKKAYRNGREVSCLAVQQELLGKLQATAPFLVGGKRQFDGRPVLFDGRPTGYILSGVFDGIDEALGKQLGKRELGFSSQTGQRRHANILDAIKDLGFLDELVNRISLVIRIPAPSIANITKAVAGGILNDFNMVLSEFDFCIYTEEAAVRLISEYAFESRTYYRGARSVIAAIAEELLFDPQGQACTIERADAEKAISRLTSGA